MSNPQTETMNTKNIKELITRLQELNQWRRGADLEQPAPRQIGKDIDSAITLLKQHERLLVLATKHCPKDHHDWQEICNLASQDGGQK